MQVTKSLLRCLLYQSTEIHTEVSQLALLKSKLENFPFSFISLPIHYNLLQEKK